MNPATLPLLATLLAQSPVTLDRAVGYERDLTVCEYSDGVIRFEVMPRQLVQDGYDARMRCEHLRCLIDTGESCWD